MANQGLLIGGVAVLGVAAYLLTQNETAATLGDTQSTSFVGISGGGDANNRTEKVESPTNFLEDCATPTTTDSTTDLGVFNNYMSAYVLVCGRMIGELFLCIFALFYDKFNDR